MATTLVVDGGNSRVVEYPPTSPRKLITGQITTDGGDGAAAGDIPASVFGLAFIERSWPAVKSDNTLVVDTAPAYDGKSLLGKAAGTAAPADIPAGTYQVTVVGY